jgi:hypothetical protein
VGASAGGAPRARRRRAGAAAPGRPAGTAGSCRSTCSEPSGRHRGRVARRHRRPAWHPRLPPTCPGGNVSTGISYSAVRKHKQAMVLNGSCRVATPAVGHVEDALNEEPAYCGIVSPGLDQPSYLGHLAMNTSDDRAKVPASPRPDVPAPRGTSPYVPQIQFQSRQ